MLAGYVSFGLAMSLLLWPFLEGPNIIRPCLLINVGGDKKGFGLEVGGGEMQRTVVAGK